MNVEKTKGLFTNRYKNMMLNKLKHKQKGILC